MTKSFDKINTVIIDDEEDFIFSLKEHLSFYTEIEICGCATKYKQAKSLMKNDKIDLVFLDIEMPVKNGFEILQEARSEGNANFSVIFYTAYDKYAIQALRESALDYILKPLIPEELKNAIERFKEQRNSLQKPALAPEKNNGTEIISLPAPTGIKFLDKNNILLFQCISKNVCEKKSWTALLTDRSQIKLCTGTSAQDIIDFAGATKFIRINQSFIVNVNYLCNIEYKTRECHLLPPFDDIAIIASRANMSEIKEKFDLL
jgi:two-component system, LytTR family, response regulator